MCHHALLLTLSAGLTDSSQYGRRHSYHFLADPEPRFSSLIHFHDELFFIVCMTSLLFFALLYHLGLCILDSRNIV
jgi:hypothetical protein